MANNYIMLIRFFIILAGIWIFFDGIISVKARNVGHSVLMDFLRWIRALLGLGLVVAGFLV